MATRKENRDRKLAAIEAASRKPALLVQHARNPRHPFHKSFPWDDAKAAQAYRLEIAKDIIKSFKLTVVLGDLKISAPYYVSNPVSRGSAYMRTADVATKQHTARITLLDELSRIKAAIIRARSLAAVFKLTRHFEKLLAAVVEVEGRIDREAA